MRILNNLPNNSITWTLPESFSDKSITPKNLWIGKDPMNFPLEVLYAVSESKINKNLIKNLWKKYNNGRLPPLLILVTDINNNAILCGPTGPEPSIWENLELEQIEKIINNALSENDRFSSIDFLERYLSKSFDTLPGLNNKGLFSLHNLRNNIKTSSVKAVLRDTF